MNNEETDGKVDGPKEENDHQSSSDTTNDDDGCIIAAHMESKDYQVADEQVNVPPTTNSSNNNNRSNNGTATATHGVAGLATNHWEEWQAKRSSLEGRSAIGSNLQQQQQQETGDETGTPRDTGHAVQEDIRSSVNSTTTTNNSASVGLSKNNYRQEWEQKRNSLQGRQAIQQGQHQSFAPVVKTERQSLNASVLFSNKTTTTSTTAAAGLDQSHRQEWETKRNSLNGRHVTPNYNGTNDNNIMETSNNHQDAVPKKQRGLRGSLQNGRGVTTSNSSNDNRQNQVFQTATNTDQEVIQSTEQPQQTELVVATRVPDDDEDVSESVQSISQQVNEHQHQQEQPQLPMPPSPPNTPEGRDPNLVTVYATPAKVEDSLWDIVSTRKGRWCILAFFLLIAIVAGGTALGVLQRDSNSEGDSASGTTDTATTSSNMASSGSIDSEESKSEPGTSLLSTPSPSIMSPTNMPSSSSPTIVTNAPTTISQGTFMALLPNYTIASLLNPTSPQSRALRWLFEDHSPDLLANFTNAQKLQRFALATLYYSTNGFGWKVSQRWLSTDDHECNWWSILDFPAGSSSAQTTTTTGGGKWQICNDAGDYVALLLNENILQGVLPYELALLSLLEEIQVVADDFGKSINDKKEDLLTGEIPTTIGLLTHLRKLDLSRNAFSSPIPSEIGMLSNTLESIVLLNNAMTSFLPTELGLLTNLREFVIYGNEFSGEIPSELGYLSAASSVVEINANQNRLNGSIPSQIGLLSTLTSLKLEDNKLQGLPTEIGMLTSLKLLNLQQNMLTALPSELGNLDQLTMLSLEYNQLSGTIPTSLGFMTQLKRLLLNDNNLFGLIPTELGRLEELQRIRLENNELNGTIAVELCTRKDSRPHLYFFFIDCAKVECRCGCCANCNLNC